MPCHISDGPPEDDRYDWDGTAFSNIAAGFDRTPWLVPTEKETDMTEDYMSTPLPDNMPLDQAVPSKSKYLTKEDCDPALLVQIFQMTHDQVEGDQGLEERAVLYFHGDTKPMILNNTNKEMLKLITGATSVGGVKNHQIVLFNDPTIMFGKKMVGGIRIRAAQTGTIGAPPAPGSQEFDDSIPY